MRTCKALSIRLVTASLQDQLEPALLTLLWRRNTVPLVSGAAARSQRAFHLHGLIFLPGLPSPSLEICSGGVSEMLAAWEIWEGRAGPGPVRMGFLACDFSCV